MRTRVAVAAERPYAWANTPAIFINSDEPVLFRMFPVRGVLAV